MMYSNKSGLKAIAYINESEFLLFLILLGSCMKSVNTKVIGPENAVGPTILEMSN